MVSMNKQIVDKREMNRAIVELGLGDLPVCVHASLRSFGWVEGGADAIVDSLLANGCTVVVPSFTSAFAISPPQHLRPPQNGFDYDRVEQKGSESSTVYTPETSEIDSSLGAVPKAVLARPGRARGNSPLNSFAAVGPLAERLVAGQTTVDVYAPLDALSSAGGTVVLMGVGLDRMTLLHLAEHQAGRTLFRRWAKDANGESTMVAVGSCSNGFPRLDLVLASIRRERLVGSSLWQVQDAAAVLEAAAEAIRNDPSITHCADVECERCRDAVLGGPLLG
jgi:aminoglycoside N3'-acetyltransferase